MTFHKQKNALCCVAVFFIFFCTLCLTQSVTAGDNDRPVLSGDVAYGEPIKFDYNQDGTLKEVQLWMTLHIVAAVGKKGEPGYLPEKGYIRRYLKDLALGVPVIGYSQFNMLPGTPLGDEVAASEITLSGNRMTFIFGGLHCTVVDGGEGLASDSIIINDGIREYPVRLLDGDITISTGKKQDN